MTIIKGESKQNPSIGSFNNCNNCPIDDGIKVIFEVLEDKNVRYANFEVASESQNFKWC
jgi:hypothetical protein